MDYFGMLIASLVSFFFEHGGVALHVLLVILMCSRFVRVLITTVLYCMIHSGMNESLMEFIMIGERCVRNSVYEINMLRSLNMLCAVAELSRTAVRVSCPNEAKEEAKIASIVGVDSEATTRTEQSMPQQSEQEFGNSKA